ncbi:MAG TPA: hypothetical protein VNZ61_02100 [Roseomonas sp.]|nr:hypothetical protein [Roseomonas sp.]
MTMIRTGLHFGQAILLAAALLLPPSLAAAQPGDELRISTDGEPQTLYRWATDRCEDEFIPDSPARAFRRADGKMALLAAHRENWLLVGDSFETLKPVCKSTLRSTEHRSEDLGRVWIQAVYTRDGRNVMALLSQDLKAVMQRQGCDPAGQRGRCWLNNIVAARSTDMGESFQILPPQERTIATLAQTYPPAAKDRYGAFTVSNIVEHQGAFYTMMWVQAAGPQKTGNCLFRAEDPFDPQSWRGWDGQAFTVNMHGADAGAACAPVGSRSFNAEVRSLTYSTRHKTWIAVLATTYKLREDQRPVRGFYYAQSDDLLNWTPLRRIMAAPLKPREEQMDYFLYYPSLLDPDSKSRNFDTIDGARPVLLFTRTNLRNGKGSMNRDLQYIHLKMDP